MQNYRNNAMPYNANYHRPMPAPVTPCEQAKDDDMVLAMTYVKWQKWQKIYDAEKALCHGTIFQELDMPFCGIGGCQK